MQKNSVKNEEYQTTRVETGYLVSLKAGDRFVIPEGYLYTFVNSNESSVLFSKVSKKCCIANYLILKKERGLAYYCIRKNGRKEIVFNPNYRNSPPIIELTAKDQLLDPDISFIHPLYKSLKYQLDSFLTKLAG
jgi:hypothetical protein